MDIIICAGLSLAGALVVAGLQTSHRVDWLSGTPKDVAITLFITQYFALKYYRVFLYHKYFSPLRHLPGPTDNHFLFGQSINLLKAESPTALYIQWMKENPDAPFIRYLSFGNREVLVPNRPSCHKTLLQTHGYSLQKPATWLRMTKEMAGDGVIVMEFEKHKRHRRLLNEPFSTRSIRRLESVFQSKADELAELFDRAISAGDERTGVIDCTQTFSKTTLDVMGIAVLGIDLGNLASTTFRESENSAGANKEKKEDEGDYNFHDAYEAIFVHSTLGKIITLGNGFMPLRWLPLEVNRRFLFATSWLDRYITTLFRTRREEIGLAMRTRRYETDSSRDLMSFLIEESFTGGLEDDSTDKELVGDLLQFMIAGHESSANMLAWSLCILARRHDIQTKVQDELLALGDEPSFVAIDKAPYFDNFVKECVRVYPPAASFHREIVTDVVIEGVHIPKHTSFDVVPSVSSLNPLIWGEDVDEIDPTRWDRLQGNQLHSHVSQAFCSGPRICPGRAFANMEIKIILAKIIREFRFLKVEKEFTIENPGFTLRPRGLEVRLERARRTKMKRGTIEAGK
ncbi:cytochrome P450 [Xylaria sp. CBS 124048]|nr:cytochrome P450 [Xylaria sp. CBS 124048]